MNEDDQRNVIEYTARLASLVAPHARKLSGKTVQFIGTNPFASEDLEGLLPNDAVVFTDGPVDEPDYVVIGIEGFDEEEISDAVEAKGDQTAFLPQDGFLDLVLFGYDWWANHIDLLNRSREWHPGMSYLYSLHSFRWPTTDAPESDGATESEGEFSSETDLHRLGYKISGMSRPERWHVLSTLAVPRLGLEEVARTIANHIRLRKAQVGGAETYSHAIGEWEHDLAKLRSTYYRGSGASFYWPSIGR